MLLKIYLLTLPVYIVLDILWTGFVGNRFYIPQIGSLMKPNINWVAIVLFYLIFTLGLVLFVISPAIEKQSVMHAILYGALFGLVTYATYDLVNLGLIKDWTVLISIIDIAWGVIVCGTVSAIVYSIASKF